MKKRLISIFAVLCMLMTLLPVTANAAGITLTKNVTGSSSATITVTGSTGTVSAVSSDTGVAAVSVNGNVVTVNGVEGKKGVVTVTVTRGSATAEMEVAVGYTAFKLNGRSVTVFAGSDSEYKVVGIEKASQTEFTGAEGTGEMTVSTDANGNAVYTVASGYELSIVIKKKGGVYAFSGSSDYASIAVKKGATKDATILLDGLSLKSQFTSAITVKKDSTAAVYINCLTGTVNTLADSAVNNADTYGPTTDGGDGSNPYYAESAVIKGKTASNITIAGGGTLNINAAAKNGVKVGANGYLTVAGTTLTVTAPNAGLSVENEMLISGGTINITTDGDAIKAEDDTEVLGTVYVTGGDITINSGDEGILARKEVNISGGSFNITAVGDGVKAEDGTETSGDVNIFGGTFILNTTGDGISAFNLYIEGGTFNITCANGHTNTSYNGDLETTPSAKAVKSELETLLVGGTFTISTPDDAIHSDGNITIAGGTYTISTRDDGVHADKVLTFGYRGASDELIHLTINNCYEGFEGADIVLNSGYATIYSTDDVINAANKNTSNYHFTINEYGGVYRLYTSGGDGIDSNGGAYFRGGDLEVYSASNTSNDPLDTEDTLALYGGVTLGCGMNQMQGSPSAGIYVEFKNLSIKSGYSIVIKDGSGNVLKSTQAYFASSSNTASYLVFSHPALVSGNTYYLYINGSTSAKTGTATGSGVSITPWVDLDTGDTNVFERVTSMGSGSRYVITNTSASTSVNTLAASGSVSNVTSTLSSVSGGYTFGTLGESNTWYMDENSHLYTTVSGTNYYLTYTQSSSGWSSSYTIGTTTDVSNAKVWEVNASGSAAQITTTPASSGGPGGPGGQTTKLYLSYSSGWRVSTTSGTCYVYAPAVAQAALNGSTYYVAENTENFGMSDIQAGTTISYRSSRSAAETSVAWTSAHISYSWEPAFDSAVNGVYVLTVKYDGVAFGTVTVRIVGEDQTVTVTFTGDYTAVVEIAKGETVPLPTAPSGFVYTYFVNGLPYDMTQPVYEDLNVTVVLEQDEVTPAVLLGDVNCDGSIDMRDVTAYLVNCGQLSDRGVANADVSGDGNVDAYDSTLIARIALGM